MNKTTQNMLIGAAIVSVISVGGISTSAFAKKGKNTFKCEGGNACKGHSACGSAKGTNACKGTGVAMTKDEKACDAAKAKNAPAAAAEKPADAPAAETTK